MPFHIEINSSVDRRPCTQRQRSRTPQRSSSSRGSAGLPLRVRRTRLATSREPVDDPRGPRPRAWPRRRRRLGRRAARRRGRDQADARSGRGQCADADGRRGRGGLGRRGAGGARARAGRHDRSPWSRGGRAHRRAAIPRSRPSSSSSSVRRSPGPSSEPRRLAERGQHGAELLDHLAVELQLGIGVVRGLTLGHDRQAATPLEGQLRQARRPGRRPARSRRRSSARPVRRGPGRESSRSPAAARRRGPRRV